MTALTSEAAAQTYTFGPYLLIPEQQLLLANGHAVRIGRRAFDLLTALVQCSGQIVSKGELMACAWPGLVVEEGNLKVNIAALRRLLGEGSGPPRYIATVIGRGYRFVADVRSSHCPQEHTPSKRIFGREDAISSILHDLEHARLVSIVGPGGVGKTTVARAVAGRAAGAFEAGTAFVDLSALHEPSRVAAAVASTVQAIPGDAHDRELLLVLDNCEHLIGAVAEAADRILTDTRSVKIVATSREPLSIRGERVRRLCGLGLPPKLEGLTAADALVFPAVQLFAERAAEKLSWFRVDDSNAAGVATICSRLDGLALAIERVAQRVGALGIHGMLDHLDRRFHMFDGYHEGPERHRTLTANLDASYSLLSASEQTTMRRLSTFGGAFSLESACIVGAAQDLERARVIEDIASLVAKSLLSAEPTDGEMHYRQAHVTRAFATEKLIENGELEDAQRRHAEHTIRGSDAHDE